MIATHDQPHRTEAVQRSVGGHSTKANKRLLISSNYFFVNSAALTNVPQ